MLKIGLTGGIGSGKSTATKYFAKLKVPIIDADKIVHRLLVTNTKKIGSHFGNQVLTNKKTLNKKKLRQIIFANKPQRRWLERLIHPQVRSEINRQTKLLRAPYCIVAIPLLFETKYLPKIDRILVIDCPQKTQIHRIHKRNHLSLAQIKAIIAAQIAPQARIKGADDIIHNTKTLSYLKNSIKKFHNYYLRLA